MEWIQGTWLDLYGAEFLMLYLPLGLAALAATWALRRWLPRRWQRASYPPLDGYETAMLAGGIHRVSKAAVSSLHDRGILSFVGGRIRFAEGEKPSEMSASESTHPVESDVLSAAFVGASASELGGVLKPWEEKLKSSLVAKGYWLDGIEALQVRLLSALPLIAWLALGTFKMVVGLERQRPVGFLTVLLVLGVFILYVLLPAAVRSAGAQNYLSEQRRHFKHEGKAAAGSSTDAGASLMAVAVLGMSATDPAGRFFGPDSGSGFAGDGGDGGGGCSGCGGCGGCGG